MYNRFVMAGCISYSSADGTCFGLAWTFFELVHKYVASVWTLCGSCIDHFAGIGNAGKETVLQGMMSLVFFF